MEAGLAFTCIGNNTALDVRYLENNSWMSDTKQSNAFEYDESTAVAYVSAERNFTNSFSVSSGYGMNLHAPKDISG